MIGTNQGLYNWVKNNDIQTPVKLEIHIDKIDNRNGYNTRYMKVMIDGLDVSQMVAEATELKTSIARNTYGDIIVNGVGMDMCFALQNRLYEHACQDGYPDMFDRDMYVYIDDVQKHKEQCATRREEEHDYERENTEKEYLKKLTKDENFFREEFSDVFEAIERYKKGEIDDIPYSYWNTKSNYRFNVYSKDKEEGEILAENEGKWGDGELVMLCCSFNEDDKDMEDEDGRLYNAYITYWQEDTRWGKEKHEYLIGDEVLAPLPDWFVKYLCDADEIHKDAIDGKIKAAKEALAAVEKLENKALIEMSKKELQVLESRREALMQNYENIKDDDYPAPGED